MALQRLATRQSSPAAIGFGGPLACRRRLGGQVGKVVYRDLAGRRFGGIIMANAPGGAGRILVVALDLPFRAAGPPATDAGRRARHRPGGECHSALVLDPGGGGKKRRAATGGGASLPPLAGGGGQQRAPSGTTEIAGRRQSPCFARSGRAAGFAPNRPRLL